MYLLTQTGMQFDYANPHPDMVVAEDLAQALAHANRFAGHTPYPYSVAQHSIAVSRYLQARGEPAAVQLAGLLHDAHEAYFGDVPTPLKIHLQIKDAENVIQAAVLKAFGLTMADATDPRIKQADTVALLKEREVLFAHLAARSNGWDIEGVTVDMLQDMPAPAQRTPVQVKQAFLRRLSSLQAAIEPA